MRGVYEGLLEEIGRRKFDVMRRPVRLGKMAKMRLILKVKAEEKRAAPRPPPPKKVAVLGAGYAGMAAAVSLVLQGHDVTLIEARALLGGRAHSFRDHKTGQMVDNGQHVFMGCYHATLDFLRLLGVEDRLQAPARLNVPFMSTRGRSVLRATLPAPFHLLSALLGFGELNAADKWAAVRLAVRLKLGDGPERDETVGAWMERWGQTPNLVRALWEPLCLAALK